MVGILKYKHVKAQSAMEYLMTYGWAILIIGIALAALFELGVFNSANYAPRAQPGSCSVSKASYPVSLQGICTNEIPQFTAQFNGQTSNVVLSEINQEGNTNSITFTVWFNTISLPSTMPAWPMVFGDTNAGTREGYDLYVSDSSGYVGYVTFERFDGCCGYSSASHVSSSLPISSGTWYFAAGTFDGNTLTLYLDGTPYAVSGSGNITPNLRMNLGAGDASYAPGSGNYGNFQISNFQVYDTALSQNSIEALYQEGIGGAPINLQSLIGWWPLNGNTNDYSGNGNNGTAYSVAYSSGWTSGYSQP